MNIIHFIVVSKYASSLSIKTFTALILISGMASENFKKSWNIITAWSAYPVIYDWSQ